jgi:hypothetical protein
MEEKRAKDLDQKSWRRRRAEEINEMEQKKSKVVGLYVFCHIHTCNFQETKT